MTTRKSSLYREMVSVQRSIAKELLRPTKWSWSPDARLCLLLMMDTNWLTCRQSMMVLKSRITTIRILTGMLLM